MIPIVKLKKKEKKKEGKLNYYESYRVFNIICSSTQTFLWKIHEYRDISNLASLKWKARRISIDEMLKDKAIFHVNSIQLCNVM